MRNKKAKAIGREAAAMATDQGTYTDEAGAVRWKKGTYRYIKRLLKKERA